MFATTYSTLCRCPLRVAVRKIALQEIRNLHRSRVPPPLSPWRRPVRGESLKNLKIVISENTAGQSHNRASVLSSFLRTQSPKWFNDPKLSSVPSSHYAGPASEAHRDRLNSENGSMTSKALEEWKETCLRQSILDAIIGILKLIGTLIMALARTIANLFKMLFSSDTRQKAAQYKQQASEKVSPHIQKTKETMERELPKLKSKLETGIPATKKSLENFTGRVQEELKDAKTVAEKRDRFFAVFADYVRASKGCQIFLTIIFVYFIWSILRFFFR